MKGYLSDMFTGKAPTMAQMTFPQSHIIYAESIQKANKIVKRGGYFVLCSETVVELYKASATPDIQFKTAAEGLTPVFSDLGFKSEKECKTFFAKDYRKLRISLGEDGKTTDWILMKQARRSKDMTSADDFMINEMALNGTVTTSCLPGQNDNYKKEKPAEGWRKERKRERKALQNSPAYIRGSLFTLAKKREPKGSNEGGKEVMKEETKGEKVTADKNKKEEVTEQNTEMEEVVAKEGGIKCSRYFAFVRNILEKKREKRARQREERGEQEGITPLRENEPQLQVNDQYPLSRGETASGDEEDWSEGPPSLISTSEEYSSEEEGNGSDADHTSTSGEESSHGHAAVPANTSGEESSDDENSTVPPLRLRGGGPGSGEDSDEMTDCTEEREGQGKLTEAPNYENVEDIENISARGEGDTKADSPKKGGDIEQESGSSEDKKRTSAEADKTFDHGKGKRPAYMKGGKQLRDNRQHTYDFHEDEDELKDISGDDSDGDPAFEPAKKAKYEDQKRTPQNIFKARRDADLEGKWKTVGGVTPEEDANNRTKYGSYNSKVLSLLVHTLAKQKGIDLSTTLLGPAFFRELVKKHGAVKGGNRLAPYTNYHYAQKKWRTEFCTQKPSGARMLADVHLYQPPQKDKIPCKDCKAKTDDELFKDNIIEKLCESQHAAATEQQVLDTSPDKAKGDSQKQVTVGSQDRDQGPISAKSDNTITLQTSDSNACPHCFKTVGDLKRHIRGNCRAKKENLTDCELCGAKILVHCLNEHQNGRTDKVTGKKIFDGCREKQARGAKEKTICKVCGKSVGREYINRHMKKQHEVHGIAAPQVDVGQQPAANAKMKDVNTALPACTEINAGIQPTQPGRQEDNPNKSSKGSSGRRVSYSRSEWTAASEAAMDAVVEKIRRQQELAQRLTQASMIQMGRQFMEASGIQVSAPNVLIPPDGNCLFSSAAHSMDPQLIGLALDEAATVLRVASVEQSLDLLDTLEGNNLEALQAAASSGSSREEFPSRQEVRSELQTYRMSGEYAGGLGDVMPQILSSYLRVPILIIDFTPSHGSTMTYFVSPEDVFGIQATSNMPHVFLRQGDHFVNLIIPQESREPLEAAYVHSMRDKKKEKTEASDDSCKEQTTSKKRDRSPSPSSGGKESSTSTPQHTSSNRMPDDQITPSDSSGQDTTESGPRYVAPNPAYGDRRQLVRDAVKRDNAFTIYRRTVCYIFFCLGVGVG